MTVSKRFFARLKRGADDVSCDKFAFLTSSLFSQREGGGEEEGGSDDDIYIMMQCLFVCLSRKMITSSRK